MRRDRNPWTRAQLARLREMRADGCSFEEIAAEVNHTAQACHSKAYTLGIHSPAGRARRSDAGVVRHQTRRPPSTGRLSLAARAKSTLRPCLCCRNDFPSQGPHNRLCPGCRRGNDDTVFTTPAVVMR
jgi:hypothetical protein